MLIPGTFVASPNLRPTALGGEGYFDVNRNLSMQNNYMLDGVDNNNFIENFQGRWAEASQPPVDAIAV